MVEGEEGKHTWTKKLGSASGTGKKNLFDIVNEVKPVLRTKNTSGELKRAKEMLRKQKQIDETGNDGGETASGLVYLF